MNRLVYLIGVLIAAGVFSDTTLRAQNYSVTTTQQRGASPSVAPPKKSGLDSKVPALPKLTALDQLQRRQASITPPPARAIQDSQVQPTAYQTPAAQPVTQTAQTAAAAQDPRYATSSTYPQYTDPRYVKTVRNTQPAQAQQHQPSQPSVSGFRQANPAASPVPRFPTNRTQQRNLGYAPNSVYAPDAPRQNLGNVPNSVYAPDPISAPSATNVPVAANASNTPVDPHANPYANPYGRNPQLQTQTQTQLRTQTRAQPQAVQQTVQQVQQNLPPRYATRTSPDVILPNPTSPDIVTPKNPSIPNFQNEVAPGPPKSSNSFGTLPSQTPNSAVINYPQANDYPSGLFHRNRVPAHQAKWGSGYGRGHFQDPDDPFQQLPRTSTQTPTPTPRTRPLDVPQVPNVPQRQDTEPRTLPGDRRPPTQLPTPPSDGPDYGPIEPTLPEDNQNQQLPSDNQNQNDPNLPNDSDEPFVFPQVVKPGRQSYPGATEPYDPGLPPGGEIRNDTSQILYGQSPRQFVNPSDFLTPPVQPQQQFNPGLVPYAPVAPVNQYPSGPLTSQVALASATAPATPYCEPCGWRPELAIGAAEKMDPNSQVFEPLYYLSLFGGFNGGGTLDGRNPLLDGESVPSFDLDDGGVFGFALGQYQGYNLRTEFEYSFRSNDVDQAVLSTNVGGAIALSDFNLFGDLSVHSGMTNVIWQFPGFRSKWIRPYIGGGVGWAFLNANFNDGSSSIFNDGFDGNSTFAWQGFAGVNTQLARNFDVFVEYRFFRADTLNVQTDLSLVNGGSGLALDRLDFSSDNVLFGVRLKF